MDPIEQTYLNIFRMNAKDGLLIDEIEDILKEFGELGDNLFGRFGNAVRHFSFFVQRSRGLEHIPAMQHALLHDVLCTLEEAFVPSRPIAMNQILMQVESFLAVYAR